MNENDQNAHLRMDFIMTLMMRNKSVFIGACAATAGLWTFNRYVDYKLQRLEEEEEREERERLDKLKEVLPQRVLSRYGLHK